MTHPDKANNTNRYQQLVREYGQKTADEMLEQEERDFQL